jgi:hypothetical protein
LLDSLGSRVATERTLRLLPRSQSFLAAQRQPHAPPQQPPPALLLGAGPVLPPPVMATVDSSFTVSLCPAGQAAGADASRIGRLTSNVSPQARQRNS